MTGHCGVGHGMTGHSGVALVCDGPRGSSQPSACYLNLVPLRTSEDVEAMGTATCAVNLWLEDVVAAPGGVQSAW
jgi:hypothetical protein